MTANELSSNEKGRHAELLAQTAFLANGYSVLEPISPQPYDLAIRNPSTHETAYVQVKTAFLREEKRYGGAYLVVRGAQNSGRIYSKDDVDMFAAVWDGDVYLFPNREISEYWTRLDEVGTKWTRIETGLKEAAAYA